MAIAFDGSVPVLESFWRWWTGELKALLPARAHRPAQRRNAVILLYDRRQVTAATRRGSKLTEIGTLRLPEPRAEGAAPLTRTQAEQLKNLQRRVKAARLPVNLRLPAGMGLVCEDLLPAGAETDLAQIMAHKIDILTPWTAEQVHFDQRVERIRPDGQVIVTVVVAPRASVAEARRRLGDLGLTPDAVDLVEDDPWAAPTLDLLGGSIGKRRGSGWLGLIVWLAVLVISVGTAASVQTIMKHRTLVESQRELALGLEQRLADLPEIRQSLDAMRQQSGFVAEQRRSTASPLIVLEVLSRLLPDTVWLTDLALDPDGLSISGYADDPPALLALLEGSPHFYATRFTAPSTTETIIGPDGSSREMNRFSINCKVEPSRDPTP